jgi:hypothetical protein
VRPGAKKLGPADTPGGEHWFPRPAVLAGMLATFTFACLTWVFFRASTLHDATTVLKRLLSGPWSVNGITVAARANAWLIGLTALFLAVEWATRRRRHPLDWPALPRPLRWAGYSFLLWTTLTLALEQGGAFIYFQF